MPPQLPRYSSAHARTLGEEVYFHDFQPEARFILYLRLFKAECRAHISRPCSRRLAASNAMKMAADAEPMPYFPLKSLHRR